MTFDRLNHWALFGAIGIAYTIVMGITALLDWMISGNIPNPLFYVLVPSLTTLAAAWLVSRIAPSLAVDLTLRNSILLCFGIELIMQIFEPIEKGLYALDVPYTGIVYLTFNFFLSIVVGTLIFNRWGKIIWWKALVLSVLELTLTILAGGVIVAITGITATLTG